MSGIGNDLADLKSQIQKAYEDLIKIGEPAPSIPTMTNNANTIRMNEYLAKSNEIKSCLISLYSEYTKQLESFVETLLSIQADLKEIVKTEASLISSERIKPRKTKKDHTKK